MILRAILIFGEAAGLAVFLSTIFMGIPNVGNLAGAAFFSMLMLVTVFYQKSGEMLGRIWRSAWGKAGIITLCVLFLVGVVWCIVLSAKMVSASEKTSENCDVIIVLGCKVNNSGPSRMLRRRLEAAKEFLVENPDVICVVSGGQGADEPRAEGDVMYEYLVQQGISPQRIIVENKSKDTYENIKFSLEKLDEADVKFENAAIVTDGFHQCRAQMIAEKQGLRAAAVSASTEAVFLPTYWVREWFALTEEILLK